MRRCANLILTNLFKCENGSARGPVELRSICTGEMRAYIDAYLTAAILELASRPSPQAATMWTEICLWHLSPARPAYPAAGAYPR